MSKDLKAERERSKINLPELSSIFEGREELKEMKQKSGKITVTRNPFTVRCWRQTSTLTHVYLCSVEIPRVKTCYTEGGPF